jgi:hypothetical protein
MGSPYEQTEDWFQARHDSATAWDERRQKAAEGAPPAAASVIPDHRGAMNVLAVELLFGVLTFGIAARVYLTPRLDALEPRSVVTPILLLHTTRYLGLMFLSHGATSPGLPQRFAVPAALGDFLAAILALIAIPAVRKRARAAKALVWIFSIEGSVDLIAAITLATVYVAEPYMGAAFWIPALWVPALLVTHVLLFRLLARPWPAG